VLFDTFIDSFLTPSEAAFNRKAGLMSLLSVFLRRDSGPYLKDSLTPSDAHFRTLTLGKIFFCVFFTSAFFAFTPQNLFADLIVQVGSAQVTEGASGYIDVFFNVPPTAAFGLAAYQIELDLSAPTTKVNFSQLAEPQNAVFPGRTPLQTASRPALPGAIAAANDDLPSGENTIVNNAGLIRVNFDTALGSAGVYSITIDPSPVLTNFSDGNGVSLSDLTTVSYVSGNITVNPVPEPAVIFMLISLVPLFVIGRSRFLK
jgi:hypothetical protein